MTTDERRRAILDCAARLFRHYGHSKTTVADIAREAQMGVGTFYLVFPSKEAIVEELSSSAHVRVLEAMRDVAEARAFDSFAERLTGVLESRVAKFHELAAEGQHACELVHCKSSTVKNVQEKFREDEAALLQGLFEEARTKGELAAVDIGRAVGLVQRAYVTLSPPWLFEQSAEDARRAAYEMCRLLLLGLTTRSALNPSKSRDSTRTAPGAMTSRPRRAR
jgi:AcrR family transcriptional regulator